MQPGPTTLVAGRITRPHGLRGEVAVEVRTDVPDGRFAVGSVLVTDPAARGPLTVAGTRWHQGRLLVRFEGLPDRTSVDPLAGTELLVEASGSDDPDAFYPHELVGLRAVDPDGAEIGVVRGLLQGTAHDLLEIQLATDARVVLVPFVSVIVPTVDVAGGQLVVDAPPGLLADGAADDDPAER